MKQQWHRVLAILICIIGHLLVLSSPARANDSYDSFYTNHCGQFWPTENQFETVLLPNGNYSARWTFQLSEGELASLRCLEANFNSAYIELDMPLRGFSVPAEWEGYHIGSTNLPGARHDVAYRDGLNEPVPALTNIRVNELQAQTPYYANLYWNASLYVNDGTPRVSFQWVPSHWRDAFNVNEAPCDLPYALSGWNPAWCIFGTTRAMVSRQYIGGEGWIEIGPELRWLSVDPSQTIQHGTPSGGQYFAGAPTDGYVVENPDAGNHHYVAAGGRLFWYDRNNAGLEADFIGQMNAKYGTTQPLKMRNADIHAIEANRDNSGNLAPGSHPPADNTFMYERGNPTQYIMQYSRASAISNIDELAFLGGVNRAVMVPAGGIAPFVATPSTLPRPPLGTVLQTIQPSDPDYEYQRDAFGTVELLWADNVSVQACIAVAKNGFPQRVPQSLVNQFLAASTYHTNKSNCDFGPSRAFYGQEPGGSPGVERWYIYGNNSPIPYTRYQYSSSLSIYCRWGASPANVMIPTAALNNIGTGQPMLHCPNNTYLRNNQTGQVFQWWDGQLHYVPNADVLTCLTMGHPEVVIGLDESQFGGAPQGTPANCAYEGKMMQAPDGQVFWVKNGQRRYVGNTMIRNCVKVRANAGDPVPVTQQTLNSYPQGDTAFCPYSVDMRFVRGDGQTQVWRVFADGTRQHALGLCDPRSDPRFAVHVVPAGEVDGHRYTGDFSPNPTACAAIP